MTDLKFADVSEFQTVDWATYGPKYKAVIVRAHNGWRADYKWVANLAGSRKFCEWRGFYQYLPASVDPRAAARAFAATVGPMLPGEVAILDLEEGTGDQRARRAAWLDELHAAVEWTYSGLYFSRTHLPGVNIDWVAAYQSTEPTDAHKLWQFSSSASFSGIPGNVDANIFHGTLDDLKALTGAGGVTDMPVTQDDAVALWTQYPVVKDMRAANPDTAPRVAPSAMLEYAADQAEKALAQVAAVAKQTTDTAGAVKSLQTAVANVQAAVVSLSTGGVDLDALAAKVADLLAQRLQS